MAASIDIRTFVGAELRRLRLRLRAGLTQRDVAIAMGSHRPIVCRNERGMYCVSIATVAAQARACGGSLAHVLYAYDVATGALQPCPKSQSAPTNDRRESEP